jgi:hypothetical protein
MVLNTGFTYTLRVIINPATTTVYGLTEVWTGNVSELLQQFTCRSQPQEMVVSAAVCIMQSYNEVGFYPCPGFGKSEAFRECAWSCWWTTVCMIAQPLNTLVAALVPTRQL